MPAKRPHVATVRLTPEQFEFARLRMARDHTSWQKVLGAGVNAYILGELLVRPDGRHTVDPNAGLVSDDETDAIDLDAVADYESLRPYNGQAGLEDPTWLDTEELRRWLEQTTGRRVSKHMLMLLLRQRFRHLKPEGQARWKFYPGEGGGMDQVRQAVVDGAIDEIRESRMRLFLKGKK